MHKCVCGIKVSIIRVILFYFAAFLRHLLLFHCMVMAGLMAGVTSRAASSPRVFRNEGVMTMLSSSSLIV